LSKFLFGFEEFLSTVNLLQWTITSCWIWPHHFFFFLCTADLNQ